MNSAQLPSVNVDESKASLHSAVDAFAEGMHKCVTACETAKEVLFLTFVMLQVEKCLDKAIGPRTT